MDMLGSTAFTNNISSLSRIFPFIPHPPLVNTNMSSPKLYHTALKSTFCGIEPALSTPDAQIHQYFGIQYATVPARFRQSKLRTSYPPITDATAHGPICPQVRGGRTAEELLFGISADEIPQQNLKHDEFECLNLNITCPAGLTPHSRIPVMLWVHGGGHRGSGSHWVYDGAPMVRKSVENGKPIMLVTFNFRLGLFGFAASPTIRDDNKRAGDEGTGNYGLRDQRQAMNWLHRYIGDFGGDPNNITLFGTSTGAADIICHLLSKANKTQPLFQRAIIQSAVFEPILPDIPSAGWHLSRVMSTLHVSQIDSLRAIEADKLVGLGHTLRAIDDGFFFRDDWKNHFEIHHHHHHAHKASTLLPPSTRSRSRSIIQSLRSPSRTRSPRLQLPSTLQPLIIGDSVSDSLLWSRPISMWTPNAVVRRVKAICQSLSKASNLLRAYDISSYTPDDEIVDRVLDLVNDARVAWPTECFNENAKRERGGHGVWRYVFDQEGPSRGLPHHAADLIYLFDTVPLPASARPSSTEPEVFYDGPFDCSDDEDAEIVKCDNGARYIEESQWETAVVDEYSYARVRDAINERWVAFAYGEAPWREDKVFVFGPEGETGERSSGIFEGRRRKQMWKEAFDPLGPQLVQKVGVELSRGPSLGADRA